MKLNKHEYEKMLRELNVNKNKWVIIIGSLLAGLLCFSINFMIVKEMYISITIGFFGLIIFAWTFINIVENNAKKAYLVNRVKSVEILIEEDKIIEKVIRENGEESVGEYKYEDIIKIRNDRNNFYLYIDKKSALVIDKKKLDNIIEFKKTLKTKCTSIKR